MAPDLSDSITPPFSEPIRPGGRVSTLLYKETAQRTGFDATEMLWRLFQCMAGDLLELHKAQ
ncbi:hypothetical protein C7H08_12030 [Marinobacter halophilus]|uniref:Uncharacterized protein n=1 Tax=Marinobacter halophilus TaxID=1323740 RepID=A0A2T1KC40_9GAMM|nr:hypothetical protein C7H08_12030 [Marinobacter halophilus]